MELIKETNQEEIQNQEASYSYFKPIGSEKKIKVPKVKSPLPKWIIDSISFSGDIQTNSTDLNEFENVIDQCLLNNLKKNGVEKLFPVQKETIPKLIKSLNKMRYFRPNDVCVLSPTGSGKTFAYAIPVINHLINRIVTQIRALVILPVSDLASQVYKVFHSLCQNTTLRVGLAISSKKNAESNNFYKLNADGTKYLCSVDILVATPGKLIDLIQHGHGFHLRSLQILIIDEADRMMNETQYQWLKSIEYAVYGSNAKYYCPCFVENSSPSKQWPVNADSSCPCSISNIINRSIFKILFSATFTTNPELLDNLSLYRPVLLNSTNSNQETSSLEPKRIIPEDLKELMIIYDRDKKPLILWHLIKNLNYNRILCFTNSIYNAHRLCQLMKQIPELVVHEFHSKQNIKRRTKILNKFQSGSINVIISTDMTARGMDIDGIDCVVCYDVPRNDTAYIHRIGRTARAGKQGTAITLLAPDELKHFNIILRRTHKGSNNNSNTTNKHIERLTVKNSELKDLMPIYHKALEQLKKEAIGEKIKDKMIKKIQIDKLGFKNKILI